MSKHAKTVTPGDASGLTDVATLRKQARKNLDEGAVTHSYTADRDKVIELLNQALATELVCSLRYRRHHYMAKGIHSESIAAEFMVHADEELGHADKLATRIVQLGGAPDFNPTTLTARSHAEYVEGVTLQDMIREDLIAERIAIDSYRELVQFLGDADPTSRRVVESILEVEEEHAEELSDWISRG